VILVGIAMLVVAGGGTMVAVDQSSTVGFFSSTVVAGIGFGAGFQGGIRTVAPLAAAHERAGVLSVLYVICYLGMGAPSVVAGVLVVHGGGLITTARDYTLFVLVLAAAALAGLVVTNRSAQPVRPAEVCASRRASGNGDRDGRDDRASREGAHASTERR
jgi:hypothetical protein